jgi:AcrR family transcriptional regulator
MSAPQRRTQAERRAAAEAALLQAAAELIVERGIEGASLRSISERAGISRAMPGYHFGSKDALIARIADRGHERTMTATAEAVERAGRGREPLSTLEALRLTIETYVDVVGSADAPEERAVIVMWGATFPTASTLPAMVESDRQTHTDLAGLIKHGQDEQSIRADIDAAAAALVIMGLSRGVAALSLTHTDVADPATVRQLTGEAIDQLLSNAPRR